MKKCWSTLRNKASIRNEARLSIEEDPAACKEIEEMLKWKEMSSRTRRSCDPRAITKIKKRSYECFAQWSGEAQVEVKKQRKIACNKIQNGTQKFFNQSGEERENVEVELENSWTSENKNTPDTDRRNAAGAEGDGSKNTLDTVAGAIKDIGSTNWGKQKSFLGLGEANMQNKECT